MPDFCVCVTFAADPRAVPELAERARAQARASLAEPGCRVFDVWTDPARPSELFLYEIYDDEAAFEEHLRTPHFLAFDAEVRNAVEAKRVLTWRRRTPG